MIAECANCGREIERFESEIFEDNVCSDSCFKEVHSEKMSGKRNPNWKEGRRPDYGYAWSQIREQVILRDNERCQVCGLCREKSENILDRDLTVHHIEPLREFSDVSDAHENDNLVTVCQRCHPKVEQGNLASFM